MNKRIKKKKGLLRTRRKFFCYGCHEFTNQKIVKSTQEGWEWQDIYVCLDCGFRMDNSWHQYNCPTCGAETAEDYHSCKLRKCNREEEVDKKIEEDFLCNPCSGCPNYIVDKGTCIGIKDTRYDNFASMNYGGDCRDWTEIHKCWNCRTIYELQNSNC